MGALLLLSVIAQSASALVVTGHSPIALLVVDPKGQFYGCEGPVTYMSTSYFSGSDPTGCTSTAPPPEGDFVNQISKEDPSYYFCWDSKTSCPTIKIDKPITGNWVVYYFSTITGTETVTSDYITISSCPVPTAYSSSGDTWTTSTWTESCTTLTQSISLSAGSSGSVAVTYNPDGSVTFTPPPVSTPQFPLGSLVVVAVLAPVLLVLFRFRGPVSLTKAEH